MANKDTYQLWVETGKLDEVFEFIKECSRKLVTQKEMCKHLGITQDTFTRLKRKYPEIEKAQFEAKINLKMDLTGALYKRAIGYDVVEETHFYSYTFKGWTPSVARTTEDKTYTAVFEKTNKYTSSDNFDFELLGNDTYQLNRYQVTSTDESVIIPSIYNDKPVSTIKINAFNGASNIKTLGIPSSIRDIKSGAFSNMVNLETIIVDESNSSFSSKGGLLFDRSQTTLLKYPEGKPQKTYLIPSGVTTIGEYAIFKVGSLESIIIPESVTNIEWIAINRTKDLIIYVEVDSVPDGWVVGWSDPEGPVYWKGQWQLDTYGIPTPN